MLAAFDRIVVGVDFTEVSLAAAQWVGRHLARDATLTLVHVIPPPSPNVLRIRSVPMPDRNGRLRARIQSMYGALHGLARVVGGTTTGVEVRVGDPAVQLPAYADMVDNLHRVQRLPSTQLFDLLAARGARCHNERVGAGSAHGRQQREFAHLLRHLEVLGLIAKCAGHATARRIHFLDAVAGR